MLTLRRRAAGEPDWPKPDGMSAVLWRLLHARGVTGAEAARAFLNPKESDLHDPMALSDMDAALKRIHRARDAGEAVCVWGDYDVDGVSATAILTGALRGIGIEASHYIPSRHDEGYGLSEAGLKEVEARAALLITVDCGVSAVKLIAESKARGLDVIVTDHHRPGEALPDCPVVNPLLGGYPNPHLCGAGVAFQLARALDSRAAMDMIDLAALATVADVVPLAGENRAIVAMGLKRINEAPRAAFQALAEVSGIKIGSVSAGQIAFQIAPRLNASGRVGSAERALKLLTARTADEAAPLAQELDAENTARRQIEREILKDAEAQLQSYDFATGRVLVLAGENWNAGVIGLAASRLVERYALPTVMLSGKDGDWVGSCRSIPGVDIYQMLRSCERHLTRYGGHRQAAGLTMPKGNLPAFRAALQDAIAESTDPIAFVPSAEYDMDVPVGELSAGLVGELERLAPTGFGNPAPVLRCLAGIEGPRAIGRDGAHLSLTLTDEDAAVRGVWFSKGHLSGTLAGKRLPVLYVPRIDRYMNRASIQMEVKAMGAPRLQDAIALNDREAERLLHDFLTQMLYNISLGEANDACRVRVDELAKEMTADPRGVLLVASDLGCARRALAALSAKGLDQRLDVFSGTWPDDPRCWNALSLTPLGPRPAGYRRLIAVDAPARLVLGTDGERLTLDEGAADEPLTAAWLCDLPDIGALRALYVAVSRLLKRPYAPQPVAILSRELGELSGLTPIAAHIALAVLRDMALIDFAPERQHIALRPMIKADPRDSRVYQALLAINA